MKKIGDWNISSIRKKREDILENSKNKSTSQEKPNKRFFFLRIYPK